MELGYWPVKGRAEPLKWLAAYLAIEIKELNFESKEDLEERKLELKQFNPFMSIPYLKFENTVVTQKRAVAQAIALKADRAELFGEGEEDQVTVSTLLGVIGDIEGFVLKAFFREEEDVKANIAKEVEENIIPKFESLSSFMGDRFFFMHYITFADFELAYLKEFFDILASKVEGFQNPFDRFHFLNRMVRELKLKPGLRQYIESEAYQQKVLLFPTSFLLKEEEEIVEGEEEQVQDNQVEGGEQNENKEEEKPAVDDATKETGDEKPKTQENKEEEKIEEKPKASSEQPKNDANEANKEKETPVATMVEDVKKQETEVKEVPRTANGDESLLKEAEQPKKMDENQKTSEEIKA